MEQNERVRERKLIISFHEKTNPYKSVFQSKNSFSKIFHFLNDVESVYVRNVHVGVEFKICLKLLIDFFQIENTLIE